MRAAGLRENVAENPYELVDLPLAGDERRRDLDDRVAAVVGPADQARVEERAERNPRRSVSHSSSSNVARVSLSFTSSIA